MSGYVYFITHDFHFYLIEYLLDFTMIALITAIAQQYSLRIRPPSPKQRYSLLSLDHPETY